jgi:flagellum-specific peptidoglycan hydrolase FlgJ
MNLIACIRKALFVAATFALTLTLHAQDTAAPTAVMFAKKTAPNLDSTNAKKSVSGLDSTKVRTIAQMISDSFGAEISLIQEFIYEAKQLETDEKVPATAFIGIAILESTGFTSYLYQNAKNPFGMRATSIWKGPTFIMFHEGRDSKFRKYDTPRDAVRDFAVFLNSRKWFRDAFDCKPADVECFIKGLSPNWKKKEPGYASDPEWPNKVRRVIRTYKLESLTTD